MKKKTKRPRFAVTRSRRLPVHLKPTADRLRSNMRTHVFEVVVEKDESRWAAHCPALPGCATWGSSQSEAMANIREAVQLYVEDMIESGEPLPAGVQTIPVPAVAVVTA